MSEGKPLDDIRVPPPERCWWCGEPGLTSEHKFKRSDLTRMWDSEDGLVWGSDTSTRSVRSLRRSKDVRFRPNLCARCNNERSQPFDRAYSAFSDYVWRSAGLWQSDYVDMAEVFGPSWPAKVLDLARYIAKHLGSRMCHEGYRVPDSIARFLDGGAALPDVHMVLFKSREHYDLYQWGLRDGVEARGLWISPAQGAVSRSTHELVMYSSGLLIGYIGIMYRWEEGCEAVDPFYAYRRGRLHDRDQLPDV